MHVYSATTEGESALVAATNRTVLQLRGLTTVRASVHAWGISFDGAVATDAPGQVRLLYQTSDGTATGCTEQAFDSVDAVALTTAFRTFTSTEPTAGGVLEHHEVHPNGGNIWREYPPGREIELAALTTARLAIECLFGANVNCVAWMQWTE